MFGLSEKSDLTAGPTEQQQVGTQQRFSPLTGTCSLVHLSAPACPSKHLIWSRWLLPSTKLKTNFLQLLPTAPSSAAQRKLIPSVRSGFNLSRAGFLLSLLSVLLQLNTPSSFKYSQCETGSGLLAVLVPAS